MGPLRARGISIDGDDDGDGKWPRNCVAAAAAAKTRLSFRSWDCYLAEIEGSGIKAMTHLAQVNRLEFINQYYLKHRVCVNGSAAAERLVECKMASRHSVARGARETSPRW